MLVLSRKIGEEIVINGNITLKVTDVGNGNVRIGFTAPRDVSIDRAEVHTSKNEFRAEVVLHEVSPKKTLEAKVEKAVTVENGVTSHPAINRIRRHLSVKVSTDSL